MCGSLLKTTTPTHLQLGVIIMATAEDYFDSVSEEKKALLDVELDSMNGGVDKHLNEIAGKMYSWKDILVPLRLTRADESAIDLSFPPDLKQQCCLALKKWKENSGKNATYRNLIRAFCQAKKTSYAEAVVQVIESYDGQQQVTVATPPSSRQQKQPRIETDSAAIFDEEPAFPELDQCLIARVKPVPPLDTIKPKAETFAKKVVLILLTCNVNEYWAALEHLTPPIDSDGNKIADNSITYPRVGYVIGCFSEYRAAIVWASMGEQCEEPLRKALLEHFPNSQVVIGAGIAYANSEKYKFADVLVSSFIQDAVQCKVDDGEFKIRGPCERVERNLQVIFINPVKVWKHASPFACTSVVTADQDDTNQASTTSDNGSRISSAHSGIIISTPTLIADETLRNKLMEHIPNAIGGEMEGYALLKLKAVLKDPPYNRNISVIIIKGVVDYGTREKNDKWQLTAAKAAMNFIKYCLDETGGIEFNAKEIAEMVENDQSQN